MLTRHQRALPQGNIETVELIRMSSGRLEMFNRIYQNCFVMPPWAFFSHLQNVETKLMDRTAVKCVAAVTVVHNVITSMATVLTGVQRDTTEECAMMVS